jgi:subtilisin-like proprotein convertase family protein
MDIRVDGAWRDYTGSGVRVAVIDDGVFYEHPDLAANYDTAADFNSVTGEADAIARSGVYSHGTQVAGFIAAPLNGVGVVGVAYDATFAGIRAATDTGALVGTKEAWNHVDGFDITNNSYSSNSFGRISLEELERAVTTGRDGLGTINVFSSGNERHLTLTATVKQEQNLPYQITVGATDHDGKIAAFSTPGANVFVSAPGENVIGNDGMETPAFALTNGTSFSTPIVSGVAALVLQANPDLGYRDVHEILGYSAYDADDTPLTAGDLFDYSFGSPTIPDSLSDYFRAAYTVAGEHVSTVPWSTVTNGAADWNGGGLTVSHDFGLGQVDTRAATRLAETWNAEAKTIGNLTTIKYQGQGSQAIPDNDPEGITQTVTVTQEIRVEAVVVQLTLPHGDIGDLRIELVSPHGTVSYLIYNPNYALYNALSPNPVSQAELDLGTFINSGDDAALMSVQMYGENSVGDWTLRVADTWSGTTGTLEEWSLTLVGAEPSADDRYVYTDQYGELAAGDPARAVLADTDGGTDTINAAAVSGDVAIDLGAGTGSIAGTAFAIAEGTVIENLYTGDGDDTLVGSSAANHLIGGRGADQLSGGAGDDTIDGGRALDVATFSSEHGDYAVTVNPDGTVAVTGADGSDTLVNVEVLEFDDGYTAATTPVDISGIGFDAALYLAVNPDVAAAGHTADTAYVHYLTFGIGEGRAANAFFDTRGYLARYSDVAEEGVNPLRHYYEFGWKEGRDPSVFFDTKQYLTLNPDVAAADISPLNHFLTYGIEEGRLSQAASDWFWM